MPYTSAILGSWSFTEGRGGLAWDHLKCNHSMLLGSVTIPSAHHTYGSVSNLVQCLPPEVVASKGPQWVNSTAPVEGDLVVEGHSLSQTSY